jgi:hypothetical protein
MRVHDQLQLRMAAWQNDGFQQDHAAAEFGEPGERFVGVAQMIQGAVAVHDIESPHRREVARPVEVQQAEPPVWIPAQHLGDVGGIAFGAEDVATKLLEETGVQPDPGADLKNTLIPQVEPQAREMLKPRPVDAQRFRRSRTCRTARSFADP